ncbi:MAG: hypothetical protein ABS35_21780 [Kaistia sp. SCN 65-12]|jgi:hypothetical protein|nr:MAG: hypothetical protein ABS35_21780 [Kaistia sp. SCN 65-12]
MRSPTRLRLTRSLAFCIGALVAGSVLAAPKDDAAKSDCLQKALVQFNIDDAGCAIYPLTSVLYGECKVRAARTYQIAMANCVLDTPSSSTRPQLRNPGRLTIKQ